MFLFMWCVKIHAQEITVSGKVFSADDNMTLPGVTVLVKGTVTGTTTDVDGKYTLGNVPSNGIMVFSFVGMQTQEIQVSGQTVIDVIMKTESFGLDEVVVIGYGT
ncbi:MAG: carboxypeptidase-like regulatory domain-containing protein, partial [Bacteroidales bacterium]|nr:carboxypeptidase-like regulatory domain-containing protein [Bacteroidales bacterium]